VSYLEAVDLHKSYGKVSALESFSLSVRPGEIYCLVGPDGAGKTTLIRILCRLLDPDKGDVFLEGRNINESFDSIKPLLGYMPQQFSLYPDLSIEENLYFYAGIYGLNADEYRRQRERLYHFSNLSPFARRRAADLSGGMKQKLALSCALIHDPRLLILDEPTTGVDPLSRRQFWQMLAQLREQGVTILVSTPYMDEVVRADRACFIIDGRKLSEGNPTELASKFEGQIFFLDRLPSSELILELNSIAGMKARRFGAGVHIYLDAADSLERYAHSLHQLSVAIEDLRAVDPTVEDRFIQLMEGESASAGS